MKTTSFVIGNFKFTAAQLEIAFDSDLVCDMLEAQQKAFVTRKGLDTAPVKPGKLRHYAKACMRHLKAHLKEASGNERQLNRLAKALSRRMKTSGEEFLLALGG